MNCPTCNVNLVMSDRQGIEIDYCPQCRGVWLDRGELDKIIERSAQTLKRDHDDDDHDHPFEGERRQIGGREYDNQGRRRRKSILGELFDFG